MRWSWAGRVAWVPKGHPCPVHVLANGDGVRGRRFLTCRTYHGVSSPFDGLGENLIFGSNSGSFVVIPFLGGTIMDPSLHYCSPLSSRVYYWDGVAVPLAPLYLALGVCVVCSGDVRLYRYVYQ